MNINNLINFWKSKYLKSKEEIIIPQEPRMYLILREDLAYKYIQGTHALAKFAYMYPQQFEQWRNKYLICLSVFNGIELEKTRDMLNQNNIMFSYFVEPDLQSNLPTAICLFDDGDNNYRKYISDLKLATK